ncbi:hypothetical protein QBC42DRAFT_11853 [Cladorrhinum samala]|uniref:Uncharacterized protein n=1 Tax=Cladorrhinum samala TaxID=585594 RepID=A0AAV9HEC0_9PEZI|nr:hypothetical protein QBC42DRAFT_11853 [Cladorrhinum samala]
MEGGEGEGEFYSPMGEEDVAFEEGDRGLDLEGDEYADEAEPLDDGYSNQEYGNEEEGDRGLDDEFEVGQLDEGGEDGYDAGGEFNSDGDYAGEDAEGVDVEEYIDEGDLGPDDGFEDQPDDCGGFDDSVDGDEVAAEDYGGDGDMDEQGDGDEIGDADYGGESAEAEGYDYDDDNMGGGEADFGVEEREQDEVNDGDYDGGFDEGENIGEDYGDGNLDQAQVDWEDDIGGVDEPAAMDADDFDVGGHEDAGGYDAGFDDRGLDDSYGDGTQEDSFGGNDYGGAYAPQESFSSTSRNDTRGFDHASTNYQPDDSASFTTTDYPQDTQSDDHLDASFPAGEPGFDEPVYNDDNQEMERSAAPESEGDAPALTHEEVPDFEPESERVQDAFAVEEEEEEEQEDQPELLREGEELEVQSVAADEEESVAGYGEQIGYQDDDEDEARSLEEVPEQSFDDGQESHDDSAPEEDDQVYEGEIMHEDDEPSTGPMADDTWEPEPAAEEEEVDNLDYVLEQEDGQLPDVAHLNHESDYERDFDQELAGQSDNEAEFGEQTSVASEGFEASEDLEASGQLHAADDRDAEGLNEVFEVEAAEEREPDENLEYVPDEPETACIDQQDGAGFASDRDFDEHADRSQDLWDDSDEIPCVLETVDDDQVNFEIQEPPLQERPEIDYVPEEPEENLEIEDDRAISESANTGEPIQQSEFVDDEPTDTYMSGEQFDQRESVTEALEPESAEGRYDGDGWGDDYREEFATDQGLYEARDFPDPGSRAASAEPAPVQVHDEQFAVDDASEEIAHSPVSIADVYSAPASPAPEDEPEVAINESFGAESASFHDEISYPPPPQPEALATEQELSEPYEPQDDASDGGDSIIDSYSDPEMDSPMSMQEPFHQDPESFQSPQQARQSTHDQDQYSPPLTPVGDSFDDGLFPGYVNDHLKSPAVASNWGRQSQLLSPRAPPTPPLEDQDGQDYQERHELPEFQEDAYPYSVYDGSEYGPMTPPPDQDAPPLPSPHIIKDRIGALDDRQYQEDREESINEEPENFDDHIILDGHDILPSQQLAEENGGEPDEFDRDAVPEFPEPLFSKPSPKQDTAAFRAQTQPIEDIDEQLPHRSLSFSDEAHDSDLGSPELEYSGIDDEPVFEMMTSGPTGSEGHYEAEERDVYIQDELQLDQAAIEVDEPVQSPPLEQAKDHFLVVPVMMSPASGFEEHQDESPVHGRHQPHLIFAEAQPAQYYEKTVRSPEPMGQDVYQTEASEPEQVNSAVPSDTPQPEMYEPYDDYPYVDPDAIPEIDNSDMQPQAAVTSSTLSREGQVHEDAEQAPLPEEQPKREPTPHAPALSLFPKRKPVENPTNVAVPPNAETPPTGNRERGDPMAQMPYQANDPMAMNATPAGETGEGQDTNGCSPLCLLRRWAMGWKC